MTLLTFNFIVLTLFTMDYDINEVKNFIVKIRKLNDKYEIIKNTINLNELIDQLLELDDLVEIYNVKTVILKHIEMLIILTMSNKNTSDKMITDDHMLHTVFYGHPGVGKSKTAKILAKIWRALGILKNMNINTQINSKEILTRINSIRSKYLNLYEVHNNPEYKESKQMWKAYANSWNEIKSELSFLADKVHSNVVNKVVISDPVSDELYVIAGRENFVAEYSGQTAIKTLNFLKSCLGKCVIIEEAYLIYHSDSDIYGMEALTVLNRFMDEFAPYIAIIFTGYEDKLRETIFTAQPGLKRRCQWIFNLKGYTYEGLCSIFLKQMNELGWTFEDNSDVNLFFKNNFKKFPNFGGDTEKLALNCKMMYSHLIFDKMFSSENNVNITLCLNKDMLNSAFESYLLNEI